MLKKKLAYDAGYVCRQKHLSNLLAWFMKRPVSVFDTSRIWIEISDKKLNMIFTVWMNEQPKRLKKYWLKIRLDRESNPDLCNDRETLNPLTSLAQSAWLAQRIAERCVRSSQKSGFLFNRLGCSFYCEDHVRFHTNNITKQKQPIEPFLKTSNTFHLRLARQISSTDPLIEWSVACYPGPWSTYRLVLDSSSNSPAGHHTVHTQ